MDIAVSKRQEEGPVRTIRLSALMLAEGHLSWEVFDAVLTPGDVILLLSWRDYAAAEAFERTRSLQEGARLRRVRVVRDYSMNDRREAPQYYPEMKSSS